MLAISTPIERHQLVRIWKIAQCLEARTSKESEIKYVALTIHLTNYSYQ